MKNIKNAISLSRKNSVWFQIKQRQGDQNQKKDNSLESKDYKIN